MRQVHRTTRQSEASAVRKEQRTSHKLKKKPLVLQISKDVMKGVNLGPVGGTFKEIQSKEYLKHIKNLACFDVTKLQTVGRWVICGLKYCWKVKLCGAQIDFRPVLRAFWCTGWKARVRSEVELGLGEPKKLNCFIKDPNYKIHSLQ